MLYVLCNKFGEPLEDGKQISDSSPTLDAAQAFVMQDRNGSNVNGFLLTIDGSVFRAVADMPTKAIPVVKEPEPLTPEDLHIPVEDVPERISFDDTGSEISD